ncbi:hypothetical protein [Fusibacter sp. 3D3]|uniref:hypothetical protein n=1 Tax=Fusibacter sp. 3D3 TaxID=1048380 RepID=UPI000852C43B|nr:hypothetical protein [Fusibacter sp. 3D3]GAU79590.1 hypothetical protein F3D3_4254 [Fusibacter sp. 3D3]
MNSRIEDHTSTELLIEELKAYEAITVMTDAEKVALRKWVSDGNSAYENGSLSCGENGRPLNFLEVYRYEQEIIENLTKLTPQDQEVYLAKLHGANITSDTATDEIPL